MTDVEIRLACAGLAVNIFPELNPGVSFVNACEEIYDFITEGQPK
ncbi:hypothetical protein [Mycolicibacterium sp. S2-37]|nr:hypothetical protein [Mycolicibacterium sp. S2-37]